MTVRAALAADLAARLPSTFRVIPYAKSLDRIEARQMVVMVYREKVNPTTYHDQIENVIRVWLLSPHMDPGVVDDQLDEALDLLIAALDETTFTEWLDAERGVFESPEGAPYAGFSITCNTRSRKEI